MACLSCHYTTALNDLPLRILSEFQDQPALRLTFSQVRRLWDLPEIDCREALDYLMRSGLLGRDPHGRYALTAANGRSPWIVS